MLPCTTSLFAMFFRQKSAKRVKPIVLSLMRRRAASGAQTGKRCFFGAAFYGRRKGNAAAAEILVGCHFGALKEFAALVWVDSGVAIAGSYVLPRVCEALTPTSPSAWSVQNRRASLS